MCGGGELDLGSENTVGTGDCLGGRVPVEVEADVTGDRREGQPGGLV